MEKPKRKRRWRLIVLLLLLLGTAYCGYRIFRTDPNVKKIRDLRKELAAGSNLTPEQRREKFQQLRETMEKLPPDKRDRLRKEMQDEGRKRFEAEMRRYASLSEQEKTRHLDEQIDRMEAARRQRQQSQGGGSASGGGSQVSFGASPNGGRAGGNSDNPAGGAAGPQGGGPGGQPKSAEDRDKFRRQRLDETTPEFRALRDQYFKDLQARRQQRGFQSWGPGR